jgi:lysyl endopeptidase
VVELYLPADADPAQVRLSVRAVSHLVVSPTGSLAAAKDIGDSDACHFDAKCVNNPSQAYLDAKKAVALMVIPTPEGEGTCTGTLLNDTDSSTQIPYFFSAAHCVDSQSVASNVTTYWFVEATACDAGNFDQNAVRQLGGGTQLLYASTASDVALLRLNSAPPTGAHYLGWDAAQVATGTNILLLHHPAGDVLKVSLGQVTGVGSSALRSGSFYKVRYTDGTTEEGSSGCGLLTFANSQYRLRGGLLGGKAACSNTGTNSPDNSDDFSRLDLAYPSLRQYLDPSSTPPPSTIDYSGAWSNPNQSGWGLVVVRGGSGTYAMYIYHYEQDTSSAWFLSAGNLSGTSYSAPVLTFTGPGFGGTFNPALVTNRVSGNLNVNFTSATTATISFTIDGRSVSTTLSKLAF